MTKNLVEARIKKTKTGRLNFIFSKTPEAQLFSVHPEDILLSDTTNSAIFAGMGTIKESVYQGSFSMYHIEWNGKIVLVQIDSDTTYPLEKQVRIFFKKITKIFKN